MQVFKLTNNLRRITWGSIPVSSKCNMTQSKHAKLVVAVDYKHQSKFFSAFSPVSSLLVMDLIALEILQILKKEATARVLMEVATTPEWKSVKPHKIPT